MDIVGDRLLLCSGGQKFKHQFSLSFMRVGMG